MADGSRRVFNVARFCDRYGVTVVVSTLVWLSVTFLTRPEPDEKLRAFYERVRPGGPGWARTFPSLPGMRMHTLQGRPVGILDRKSVV